MTATIAGNELCRLPRLAGAGGVSVGLSLAPVDDESEVVLLSLIVVVDIERVSLAVVSVAADADSDLKRVAPLEGGLVAEAGREESGTEIDSVSVGCELDAITLALSGAATCPVAIVEVPGGMRLPCRGTLCELVLSMLEVTLEKNVGPFGVDGGLIEFRLGAKGEEAAVESVVMAAKGPSSGPGSEAEADEETGGEDKDGDGICGFFSIEGRNAQAREYGLTAPELGGCKFPFPSTVHPAGTTDAVAVPSQGHPVRVA